MQERRLVRLLEERYDAPAACLRRDRALADVVHALVELVDDLDRLIVEDDEATPVLASVIGDALDAMLVEQGGSIFRGAGYIDKSLVDFLAVHLLIAFGKRRAGRALALGGDLLRDLPKRLLHLLRLLIKRLLFVEKNVIVGDFHLEQRAGVFQFHIRAIVLQDFDRAFDLLDLGLRGVLRCLFQLFFQTLYGGFCVAVLMKRIQRLGHGVGVVKEVTMPAILVSLFVEQPPLIRLIVAVSIIVDDIADSFGQRGAISHGRPFGLGEVQSPAIHLRPFARADGAKVEMLEIMRRTMPRALVIDILIHRRKRTRVVRCRLDLIWLKGNKLLIRIIDAIKTCCNQILTRLNSCTVLSLIAIQSLVALPLIGGIADIKKERTDICAISL